MDGKHSRAPDDKEPVIIGTAQWVGRHEDPADTPAPQDILATVARAAADDAGLKSEALTMADTVAVIRLFADSAPQFASPFGGSSNWPKSLADRIGAAPRRMIYPFVGGNTPQWLINELAESMTEGDGDFAVIASVELMRSTRRAMKAGIKLDWSENPGGEPEMIGDPRPGVSPLEMRHGLGQPADTYPLFENALAHHYGRRTDEHRQALGRLFAPFSAVAADNPYAAMPIERDAHEIAAPSEENRLIAWPYTKFMNANATVDQSAAVIVTSVGRARALGVPVDKWVFLRGSADIADKWLVTERVNYYTSPAIRIGAARALGQAGMRVSEIDHFDIYSCFPSAVEIAADEIGLAHDDPRGLTVTGGLPYFGGPGNAYSLHAIARMADRLRARPGSAGLITANGWYLTKHAFGVYSTKPGPEPWRRPDPAADQAEIDAMTAPEFVETAEGSGRIETFTVTFGRNGPKRGIIIGRLADNRRFLANTPEEESVFRALMRDDVINCPVEVTTDGQRNQAIPLG